VERRTSAIAIAPDSTRLEIAIDSLMRLPEGAEYRSAGVRTSVRVSRKAGDRSQLVIEARSAGVSVPETSEQKTTLRTANKAQSCMQGKTTEERRQNGVLTGIKWFIAGIIAGAIIITGIKIIIKKRYGL
jgi:hypothetical protein